MIPRSGHALTKMTTAREYGSPLREDGVWQVRSQGVDRTPTRGRALEAQRGPLFVRRGWSQLCGTDARWASVGDDVASPTPFLTFLRQHSLLVDRSYSRCFNQSGWVMHFLCKPAKRA
jgi:hypothetical protein